MKFRLFLATLLVFTSGFAQLKYAPEKPVLIIGIVVEQMRYDYITTYWDNFGENGFKRLIYEGTNCKNTKFNYLLTQSASGFASISSGTEPAVHGIVSDYWFDRLSDKYLYAVTDDNCKTVGSKSGEGKCSPAQMAVSTFADELKIASKGQSKSFAIALRDQAAVLLAGHSATGAFWLDNQSGKWITSSHYSDTLPSWVKTFNDKALTDFYLLKDWTTLVPMERYKSYFPDNNQYEEGFSKTLKTFPHAIPQYHKQASDFRTIRYTPYGNTLTTDFAIATILEEKLGTDEHTDFLTVSYSVNHYISDKFGPGSVELADVYLRLDLEIARILTLIDERFGKRDVVVYLTSNQGDGYAPGYLKSMNIPSGEFKQMSALALLKTYLKAVYGRGEWIKTYTDHQIYLNRSLIEESGISLVAMQTSISEFMVQFTGVATALGSESLKNNNFTQGIYEKFRNSYHQRRSGDIIINLEPGWVQITESSQHSSAYNYDTHVPLIWYGWKMKRKTISRAINVTDIAPTLSDFLNISFPNAASGNPIFELIEQ
ncbi:MAG TPA: alkaline phosphatase family protein [Bacteroidales bacterium]|nr:alkaline phosphatase family protein [Bacteroidales bacterium]